MRGLLLSPTPEETAAFPLLFVPASLPYNLGRAPVPRFPFFLTTAHSLRRPSGMDEEGNPIPSFLLFVGDGPFPLYDRRLSFFFSPVDESARAILLCAWSPPCPPPLFQSGLAPFFVGENVALYPTFFPRALQDRHLGLIVILLLVSWAEYLFSARSNQFRFFFDQVLPFFPRR